MSIANVDDVFRDRVQRTRTSSPSLKDAAEIVRFAKNLKGDTRILAAVTERLISTSENDTFVTSWTGLRAAFSEENFLAQLGEANSRTQRPYDNTQLQEIATSASEKIRQYIEERKQMAALNMRGGRS